MSSRSPRTREVRKYHLLTDFCHLFAKLLFEILRRHVRILDRVVQDGRLQDLDGRVRVQARFRRGEQEGDVDRVLDVRGTGCRLATLLAVRDGGEMGGFEQLGQGRGREVPSRRVASGRHPSSSSSSRCECE